MSRSPSPAEKHKDATIAINTIDVIILDFAARDGAFILVKNIMWQPAETNTHQDHVIAHVIGASVLSYFVWDETAYLQLDIPFIWNVYLDGEMGLLPERLALAEMEVDEDLRKWAEVSTPSPIQSVEVYESEDGRRLVLNCENASLTIETSFSTRDIKIKE